MSEETQNEETLMSDEQVASCASELANKLLHDAAENGSRVQRTNQLNTVKVAAMHILASIAANDVANGFCKDIGEALQDPFNTILANAQMFHDRIQSGQTDYVDFEGEDDAGEPS